MIVCEFEREDLEFLQRLVGITKSLLYPLEGKTEKELLLFYELDDIDFKLRFLMRDDK